MLDSGEIGELPVSPTAVGEVLQRGHDVLIDDVAAVHPGNADEPDVERVFVGADLRHAREISSQRQAQQLRNLCGGEHQLEHSVIRRVPRRLSIFAEYPQYDRQARRSCWRFEGSRCSQ